jgi:biopolymer transport protein ExbD
MDPNAAPGRRFPLAVTRPPRDRRDNHRCGIDRVQGIAMRLAMTPGRSESIPAQRATSPGALSIEMVLLLALLIAGTPLLARALSEAAAPAAARELRLQVGQRGDFRLDGRVLDRRQLDQALRQAQASSPDLRLLIATADDGDYRGFVGALAAAEHAGVRNIGSEVH